MDRDQRDAAALLNGMSEGARRLLWDASRWWVEPDGGLQLRLTAWPADVEAAHELVDTLVEAFDLQLDEGALDAAEGWDDGPGPLADGMTLAELRSFLDEQQPPGA